MSLPVSPEPFPPIDYGTWKAAAEKTLRGRTFDEALTHDLGDGITIRPLYESAPEGHAARRVGSRGPARNVTHYEPETLDELVRDLNADARGGSSAFLVRSDADGPLQTKDDIARIASLFPAGAGPAGAGPAGAWFGWDAGADALAAASVFAAYESDRSPGARVAFTPCADPLATLASRGHLPRSLDTLAAEACALVAAAPARGAPPLLLRTAPYHAAGARPAQEVGLALASGVHALGMLVNGGVPIADAASAIGFSISIGREIFPEAAKFRALRISWSKVLAASGVPSCPTWIHAIGATRTITRRDPWVNMLRTTTQTFAALVGGADAVTARPFDEGVRVPSALARRLARNTPEILLEECYLGQVADPAGGSYAVESLTDEIARAGWEIFRALESEGGLAVALQSGFVQHLLEQAWASRAMAIESGELAIVGVSVFADENEVPLASSESKEPSASPETAEVATPALDLAATSGADLAARLTEAARAGARLRDLRDALNAADPGEGPSAPALPRHRDSEAWDAPSQVTT